jgi:hypothetical protein
MELQAGVKRKFAWVAGDVCFGGTLWLDGTDGQEDELDDVHKGILDAPTDDEGAGEICESNKGDVSLETADEDALPVEPLN